MCLTRTRCLHRPYLHRVFVLPHTREPYSHHLRPRALSRQSSAPPSVAFHMLADNVETAQVDGCVSSRYVHVAAARARKSSWTLAGAAHISPGLRAYTRRGARAALYGARMGG
jgi:hypothetical protein